MCRSERRRCNVYSVTVAADSTAGTAAGLLSLPAAIPPADLDADAGTIRAGQPPPPQTCTAGPPRPRDGRGAARILSGRCR
jgi:hypothetical protein